MKRGHAGNGRYVPIRFGVVAENMIAAIDFAKQMPGVKHNSGTAVLSAAEISREQYIEIRRMSAYERSEGYGTVSHA